MPKRESFIGAYVSDEEKAEIIEMAKGMGNISVSDLIRFRLIRPMITLPEAIQNMKMYMDIKFKKFELKITELIKEQLGNHKIIKKEYEPIIPVIEIQYPLEEIIDTNAQTLPNTENRMKKVLEEMVILANSGEKYLTEPPSIEIERKRAKTDQTTYKEWKIEIKGRKRLRETSVFVS